MKKDNKNLIIIILSIVLVLLLFGIMFMYFKMEYYDDKEELKTPNTPIINKTTNNAEKNGNYISSDEALDVVLNSLNINKNNIYDVSSELDNKFGVMVYEIDFKYNRYEYEFYINAKTAEVLKSFRERD